MKNSKLKLSVLSASSALALALFFASPTRATAGDVLHLASFTVMTNHQVERRAVGVVTVSQKTQGASDQQSLAIALQHLTAQTPYELTAVFDTDTNLVDLGPFTTDAKGRANFNFTSYGNGHGGGRNATTLPSSLNPVCLLREVDIVDTNLQVVLSADLTSPQRFQYLIQKNLRSGRTNATLFILANQNRTHFRLQAGNLAPRAIYQLQVNDEITSSGLSNRGGQWMIQSLASTPPAIFDLRYLAVLDSSSNIVLQTDLP